VIWSACGESADERGSTHSIVADAKLKPVCGTKPLTMFEMNRHLVERLNLHPEAALHAPPHLTPSLIEVALR
jgi:chromatin remodeling complex protein RSC6